MAVPVFLAKVYFLTLLAKIRRRLSDVTIKQDLNITVRLWTIAKGVLTIRNMNPLHAGVALLNVRASV